MATTFRQGEEGGEDDGSFSLVSINELVPNGVKEQTEGTTQGDLLLDLKDSDQQTITIEKDEPLLMDHISQEEMPLLEQQPKEDPGEEKELQSEELKPEGEEEGVSTIHQSNTVQPLEQQEILIKDKILETKQEETNEDIIPSLEQTEEQTKQDKQDHESEEKQLEKEMSPLKQNDMEEEEEKGEEQERGTPEEKQLEEDISPLEEIEKNELEEDREQKQDTLETLEQTEMADLNINIEQQEETSSPLGIQGNGPAVSDMEKDKELVDSLEEPENYKPIQDEVYDFDVPDEFMDISFNLIPSTSADSDSFDLDAFLGIPKHLPPPPPSSLVSSNVDTLSKSDIQIHHSKPTLNEHNDESLSTQEAPPTYDAPPIDGDDPFIICTPFNGVGPLRGLSNTHSVVKVSPILQENGDQDEQEKGEINDENKENTNNATFDISPAQLTKLRGIANENTNSTFTINGESPSSITGSSNANISGPSTDENITGPSTDVPSSDANISGPSTDVPSSDANISEPSTDVPSSDANISGPSTTDVPLSDGSITGPSNVSLNGSLKSEGSPNDGPPVTTNGMPKLKGSIAPASKLVKKTIKPHPPLGGKITHKSKDEGTKQGGGGEEIVKSKLIKGGTTCSGIKRPTSAENTKTAKGPLKSITKPTGTTKISRPISSGIPSKTTAVARPSSAKTTTTTSTKSALTKPTTSAKSTISATASTKSTSAISTKPTTATSTKSSKPLSGSIKSSTSIKPTVASTKLGGATKPSGIPPPVKKTRSTIIGTSKVATTTKSHTSDTKEAPPKVPPTKTTTRLVAPKKVAVVKSITTKPDLTIKGGVVDSEEDSISLPSNQSTPIATPPRRRTIGTPSKVSDMYSSKDETTPPHNKRRSMIPTPRGKTVRDSEKSIKPIPFDDGEHIVRRVAQPRLLKGLAPPKGGARSKLTRPVKESKLKEEPVKASPTNEEEVVPDIAVEYDAHYEQELLSLSTKPKVVHSPINKENLPTTPHSEWSPIQRKKTVLPEDECLQCTKYTYKINNN